MWNLGHPKSDLNKAKERAIGKACTTVPVDRQRKKARNNKKNDNESLNPTEGRKEDRMVTETKRIKIAIVGDSQLRFLSMEKMANDYHTLNERKIRAAVQKTEKKIVTSSLYMHRQITS